MDPSAGIGLKAEHFQDAIASPAAGLWFEVHAENYMVAGGPRLSMLDAARAARPLSLHGVGMSLASKAVPDADHLAAFRRLVDRYDPFLVSEHLAWSRIDDRCFPDLLPFPRTTEALACLVRNIAAMQEAIGRRVLIENPAHYVMIDGHDWAETDFLIELVSRSGCGLLVDVNNVAVGAHNLGFDPCRWLDALPASTIGEIHVAGHSEDSTIDLLIDTHDAPVCDAVWALVEHLVARIGPRPLLIERDGKLPPFAELMVERDRAAAIDATVTAGLAHV